MSVKIMGMVWDLDIEPHHKYVLLAYADHADHTGRSIFPAMDTVANKTGYTKRNVRLITRELQKNGYLVPDGKGPKGTNKWRIPTRGGKLFPPEKNDTEGGKNLPLGGEIYDQGGKPASPDPSLEPSIEPSGEPPLGGGYQFPPGFGGLTGDPVTDMVGAARAAAHTPDLDFLDESLRPLAQSYCSGLHRDHWPTKYDQPLFRKILKEWQERGFETQRVIRAVAYMNQKGLSIGGPHSLTRVMIDQPWKKAKPQTVQDKNKANLQKYMEKKYGRE